MYRKVIYIKQEDHQLLRAKSRLEQYIEVNSGFRKFGSSWIFLTTDRRKKNGNQKKSELWETESLNKVCRPVEEMTPKIQELVEDMLETMYDAYGVGLAAPQVGMLKQLL